MTLTESDARQFLDAIYTITEETKNEILKKEKGSMDKRGKCEIKIITRSYTRLAQELFDKKSAKQIAEYLYFEFEKPSLHYLGFSAPDKYPYKS